MKTSTLYRLTAILLLSFLLVSFLPTSVQAQAWYSNSWSYRKAITIDYTKVGTGPHTNFPVLISITDADLQAVALSTGNDILFTSSDGTTKLAHEIESYTSASGALVAWLKVPILSSSANTVIYMYYGNAAAASQQNVTGSWDATFKGVYHLNNAYLDATSNSYDGTNAGTFDMPGKISRGRGYNRGDGGGDYITIAGQMGSPTSISVSAWVNLNSSDANGTEVISLGDHVILRMYATSTQAIYYNGSTWLTTTVNTGYTGGWHYLSFTYTSGGNNQKLYVDGVQAATSANTGAISYAGLGANTLIGAHGNGAAGFYFDGTLDEARISGSARSAGWILTEYNNQNSPSTFYSVGSQTAGATKTFTGTGTFGTAARWTGGTVPVAGDNLIIDGACTVDNNAGTNNIAYGTLIIGTATARTLNWATSGTNQLNVASLANGTANSTLDMTNGGTLIIRGALLTNNLSFISGTGTVEFQSSLTLPANTFNNLTINGAGITAGLSSVFTITGTLNINAGTLNTNNYNLSVGGNWVNKGTFTPGTGTVTFNGTTVMSGTTATNTFNNFSVAASSTVTSSTGITGLVVNGTLTTGASATLDLGTTTILSGTLGTITNAGTIKTAVSTATSLVPIPAGKTWGGTIDYYFTTGQTVAAGTYNNLTVRPGNSWTTIAGGNLVVNGTLTVTTGFGAFDLSTYILSGTLSGISNSGDIKTSVPTTTSTTPIPTGKTWGGTIYYNAAAGAQTVVAGIYNILVINNTSGTNTATGDLTVTSQLKTTAGGTLDMGTAYRLINGGTITNNGTVKTSVLTTTSTTSLPAGQTWGGTGTVEYAAAAGAQTIVAGTYNSLKLSNTSGTHTAGGNITVGGVLTFTAGTITTGSYTVYLNSTGTVSRTSGHVIGNFKKYIATGATSKTFEMGDAANYTPVSVVFTSVTTGGDLTANITATDHTNLSGSGIRTDKSVNRYYTLTSSGIVFTTAAVTMNWVAGDVDAGATTANFKVGKYINPTWILPAVASPLSTSIQATGLTAFGDFAVGESCALSAAFTYTGSPYCSNGGTATPAITGTAGTFTSTAGLSVNAVTGAVNVAASTAGTYTVTNTVAAGGGCSGQTATASITITTLPAATISYSGSPFCKSIATAQPVTLTGTAGGTYTSTAGLTINASTGAVTPGTSTAGTYTVTYTMAAAGGCAVQTATATVTITALPAATISYSGSPFCTSAGTAQSVTLTGTTGGTYSSLSALTINASTGAITPGTSTAGTYTVTYTMATTGGCAAQTATTSVTITTLPAATISYSGSPFCTSVGTAQSVTQTGTTGGVYSSTTGLIINSSTGAITPNTSTAGTYTVTYTMAAAGGCAVQTATASVTITTLPAATISYSGSPFCKSVATAQPVTQTGTTGGTYTSTAGLTINASTGAITPATSTAGTYTVTYTMVAAGGCTAQTATISVTITAIPTATISYTGSPYCSSAGTASASFTGTTGGTYTSTAGLVINSATGAVTLATSTAGTYTVTYTIAAAGGCSTFITTATITVTAAPSANFSYTGTPYCSNAGTASVSFSGTTGGTYTSTAGLTINAATGAVTLATSTAGAYTVTYTIASAGGCSVFTTTATITLTAAPSATISYAGSPYCTATGVATVTRTGTAGGTYSSTAGLVINSTTGDINLATSTTGTYTVTYTIAASGGCIIYTTTTTVSVFAIGNNLVDYINGAHGVLCNTVTEGGSVTLTAPAGTVFINVAFASYGTPAGVCSTFTIGACHATTSQAITESYLLGNNTGTIVANNTVFGDPCNGTVKQFYVQAIYTQPICSGTAPGTITGTTPTGGNAVYTYLWEQSITSSSAGFSAAGGTNNAKDYTPGILTQTTWYRRTVLSGGCSNISTVIQITVTPLPAATIAYAANPYCSNAGTATVTRTGTTTGTYSSTAGLTINSGTGDITLASSTAGTYTVTYTMAATGGCAVQTATASVTITTLPAATISYNGSPYCSSLGTAQAVTFSGTTGGVFSSTAGLTINASSGAVTPGTSTAGTYTVTYTMAAAGGCAVQTATATVTITTVAAATISYAGSPFCVSVGTAQAITQTGTAAGVYSALSALTINATTGEITPGTSTPGTYTVTYTMAATGGCAAQTATTSVTITALPAATITYSGSPFCNSVATAQPVTLTGTAGGTYTSTAGLTINASTGAITPNTSTSGTYTVTYTMAAAGGCAAQTTTASVTITTLPVATISYSGSPFCSTLGTAQSVTRTGTTGGTYTSTAGLTINASSGAITPGTSTTGAYTVIYTMAATGGCAAQTATASVTITELPAATISYSGSPFCSNAGTGSVTLTGTTGGTYSSTAGLTINASTGVVTSATSTVGTYTVTYTMAAAGGCAAQTATTSVTITTLPAATISYSGSPFCKSVGTAQPVTQTGTTGGTYSSTSGLTIDVSTGAIIPGTSVAGTYTITYTMTAAGGCADQTAATSVTITAIPAATISYAGSPYLVTAGNASVTFSGTAGGTYSSTAGLTINATTGDVTLSSSTPGTYTVTYTVAGAGGCSLYASTASITVVVTTKTFTGTGNFSDPARWTSGTLPNAGENLVIDGACTVDNSVSTDNVAYGTLQIGTATGRTIAWSASGTNRLNVTNVSAGSTASTLNMTNGGTLIIRGTWASTNLTFTSGAGTIDVRSTITLPAAYATYRNLIVNGSGITVKLGVVTTVNGNVTITTGTLSANNFNLIMKGNWTNNVSTTAFTGGTATVTFSGSTAQTIGGSFATTFTNLTIANTASTVTLTVNGSITGNLSVTVGVFDLGAFTANRATAGGTLSVANNTTLKIGGTNTFPTNYTTNTLVVASTVEYYGTNQTVANKTYGNLTLSSSGGAAVKTFSATAFTIAGNLTSTLGAGTSVTFAAASILTIAGNVTIGASTTFNGGSFTNSVAGNWVNSGTFNGNTGTISFTGPAKGVSGSGTQNFNNLTVAASLFTFSNGSISLSGNLATISSGSLTQASGGTLLMTGTSKTISGTGISLDNLTVSGTVTTAASFSLTGNLSVSGSFTASTGSITMSGASKTISGAGSTVFAGLLVPGSVTTAANFSISNSLSVTGSFSASAGTATFTGTSSLSGTANLFNTTINGTSLQLTSNSILGIANTLAVTAGTLNVSSSVPNTVNFNGTGAQNINAITYNNLILSNGNTKTAAGAITANKDITIETGTTFTALSFTHSIYGNWINNGTFVAGTSTVQFAGPATAYLTGATTFNILTSNTSSASTELILNDNVSASIVNMTTGIIRTGTHTITITNTRTGNGNIYGTIQRTHLFTTGVGYAFKNAYNTITFASVSGVTSITVHVNEEPVIDFPPGGAINLLYNITVPAGTYNATLRLSYEDDELNGADESTMGLWNHNGTDWIPLGKSANDTTINWVEESGLTNINNRWTCGSTPQAALWTGAVSTDWNDAANWTVAFGTASLPPSATDVAAIGFEAFNHQPTISTAVTVKNVFFGNAQAATLTMVSGGSLISADIVAILTSTIKHTINANDQSITINGNLTLCDTAFGTNIDLNIGSGTVTVLGSLIQTGGANINFSGAGTLNIHKNFDHSNGTFTAGNGTVIYNGDQNQQVANVNYNNLTINKTAGLAAIDSVVNIAGNLLISDGELDNNSTTTITGNVTIASGADLQNNYMLHIGGNWLNTGTFIGAGAHVVFNGSGTQTISATTFNNLVINKPVGSSAVLTGNIVLNGDLTVTSGTLNVKSFTCDRMIQGGIFTLADSATYIISGNNAPFNFASGAVARSSTVIADGTDPQAIFGENFGNLIFRNAGAKTLISPISVNGNLTIESGSTFNAGIQTLTLNGNWINNGTFTPSTSTIVCTGIGKTISGVTTFKRFSVYGSYTLLSNITFDSLLTVNAGGEFYAGSNILVTMNGDLVNSGILYTLGTTTFTGNVLQTLSLINAVQTVAITVNFNGSVSPVLNSTAPPQYGYLTINNTAGINPSVGWTILYAMTVGSGASFNGGNSTHTIMGNLTNNGIITSSGSLNFTPATAATVNFGNGFSSTGNVVLSGAGALTLAGTPTSFYNLRVSNTNAAGISPVSDLTVTNQLFVNSGAILNAGNHHYFIGGHVTNEGTVNSGTSTFTFNGAVSQTASAMVFYNLEAANTGNRLTLLDATVNNNLSVTTGTLSIGNNEIPRILTVNGNITIASGTTLNVDTASTATHLLTVSGNIINNGTLNLQPDANSLCNTTFNKVGTQTISGTGATTNFNNITVNKGVVDTNHLDVTATNFSAPSGFLTLSNGSFNLNSSAAVVTPFTNDISTGNFLIPATSGLWVNAGTINSSAMNWTVAGSVKVTGGTMNMGSGMDNAVIPQSTGTFLVTAGNLNLASRISNPGVAWSLGMQGGTMTVNTQGSTAAGAAAFNMDAAGSAFNMSGGTIIIKDAGGSAGQNLGYNNLSTAGTGFTGGTLQIGNILTTASQILGMVSTRPIYNLTVNSANATAILQTPVLAVSNNVTVTIGTLNIDSLTLKIGGAISNSGTFTASRGTIEMNGTLAQTIPAAAFAGNNLKGFIINNNAGVTLSGAINLTDVLTVSTGSLASDGYLTLKSSATATARVAPITSIAATPVSGNVITERYVPGRRKYRLITSPVTTSASSVLTAGQESLSIWGHWQNSGNNTTPLVGNFITGGSAADGFDQQTTNNSLFTYDDVNKRYVGYSTANGKNTKYTPLKAGIAYFMFVYGDRMNSISTSTPHNTVISSKGLLKTGNQVYTTSSAIPLSGVTGRFTLLGNPFASPIDWSTIVKTDIENTFWGWDPNLSSTGGYITVTTLGNVTLIAPFSGSTGLNQYIQSGQGFFVKTSGPSPVLTLREQDKVSDFNGNAFRMSGTVSDLSLLAINLQYAGGTGKILADGVLVVFDSSFAKKAGAEDAVKMPNLAENMAILNDTTSLSLDARPMPKNNDTIYLNTARLTKPQYTLQIFAQQMTGNGVQAYLHDRYLNTVQALSLTDTNRIVINVNAGIPASADINRFRIVFHSSVIALPVTYTSIKATKQNKDIRVDWEVAEESGIEKYEVERSGDGINFNKVGEVTARGNNTNETYHWLDVNTLAGNNYYRVRAIELDGKFLVSKVVVVKMTATDAGFTIYPNPVKNYQVNIRSDEMEKGEYTLVLFNPQGQQIVHRVIDHTGGAFNQVINLSKTSLSGIYFLQITGEKEIFRKTIFLE